MSVQPTLTARQIQSIPALTPQPVPGVRKILLPLLRDLKKVIPLITSLCLVR
nr:MAG TPA: hypothetical protein [Caudoviricetes sp.]